MSRLRQRTGFECLLERQGSRLILSFPPISVSPTPQRVKNSVGKKKISWNPPQKSSKLAYYASPPLSPKHWAELDLHRSWDSLMDGDQRMKQNERSMSRSGNAARRAPGRATDSFDPAIQPRGDQTGMSQPPEQVPMSYDYGYTGSSFHGGSLQSNDLQNYQPQDYVRAQRPQQAPAIQQRRRAQPQDPAAFSPYDSTMLYGFGQQGPTQGQFEVVPQYPTRQSAAIDVLSNQFAVPQYFAPEESAGSGVAGLSPYLNAQLQPYNQPGPMARPNTTQSFPAPISDFTAIGSGSMNRLDQPQTESQQQESDQPSLEGAIGRYQRILRRTFDQTRAGRLVEAGGSLIEISEWLVTNARDLGKMHSFFFTGNISYCFCFFAPGEDRGTSVYSLL